MNYSIGKIPNKYNFFVLTVTLLLMSTGATPDFASDNCRSATEIWEDQINYFKKYNKQKRVFIF